LAGLVWFVVWLWTEHRGLVITLLVGAFIVGVAVAAVTDSQDNQRRATEAANQLAMKERADAEEANHSGLVPTAPAGRYPDPSGPGRERWWSGTSWVDRSRHSPGGLE
jgi:hypothetical protein